MGAKLSEVVPWHRLEKVVLDLVVERSKEKGKNPLKGTLPTCDVVRGVELPPDPTSFRVFADDVKLFVVRGKYPAIAPTMSELVGKCKDRRAQDAKQESGMEPCVNPNSQQQNAVEDEMKPHQS